MTGATLDALHRRVLRPSERWPMPPLDRRTVSSLDEAERELRRQLSQGGLGLIRFERSIGRSDFVDLGRRFGELMVEDARDVQPFVDDGIILHLRQAGLSGRIEDAPFEPRELLLHTEGSRRPAAQQPRFIMLHCIDAGADQAAQTVLIPFPGVLRRLAQGTREVLRETRETRVRGGPTILASWVKTEVFSFRDLGEETYRWDSPYSRERVKAALVDLLTTCYTSDEVYGSHWCQRDLMIIDNRRWFHGRTWSCGPDERDAPRHLIRLRIREP